MSTALVALAGAAGAVLRYRIGVAVGVRSFPWATLGVNLVGCFLFTVVYLALGYVFGRAITRLIERLGISEVHVIGAVVVVGSIAWLVREWRLYHEMPEEMRTGWRPRKRRR